MLHPGGFRAAEASRVFRIDLHDYQALAAARHHHLPALPLAVYVHLLSDPRARAGRPRLVSRAGADGGARLQGLSAVSSPLRRLIREALARAGLEREMREFHYWRHTGITNDAAVGMPPVAIMRMAGHTNFATT
jgi:hypothetical protein